MNELPFDRHLRKYVTEAAEIPGYGFDAWSGLLTLHFGKGGARTPRGICAHPQPDQQAVQVLVTFGLFLILEDLQRMVFGVQSVYQDTPMSLLGISQIGGIVYLNYQLLLIALAIVVLIALKVFIAYSRTGKLLAAVVADREVSQAMGIDTGKMFVIAFTIGVFLAALGGALPEYAFWTESGHFVLTAVLGGIAGIAGPLLGSIFLEVVHTAAVGYFAEAWNMIVGITLLVVIFFLPRGLFGLVEKLSGIKDHQGEPKL